MKWLLSTPQLKSLIKLIYQSKDSCIAESVMLQFVNQNQVAMPIHDSFMMQEGYAGQLEEATRHAFYDEFAADIPLKQEVILKELLCLMRVEIHALKKLHQMIRNIANGTIGILCGYILGSE